jgi:lipoprotein-anchoring transpeptidase ErfK/SrfK
MLRLRELAGAAGLAMFAMTAVVAFPTLQSVRVSFHPEIAGNTIRLASEQANSALHFAFGGTQPVAPQKQPQPIVVPDPAQAVQADAADRLRSKIPSELYGYFDVYLYVSKAASGSLAQHLYMFHKDGANNLVFEQSFPVSTGRERHEKYFTSTPTGLFELDPHRFERVHYSHTWNGAAMPYAMFLNATLKGTQTGIALHSASSHVAQLGSRASGGCVRLPPEKAAELFERFQAEEHGMVPVFTYDASRRRTNGEGVMVRDAGGRPILTEGYRVLLFIEDYPGGPALVAVVA